MENEKGKQSKLVKIESFKEECISQGKGFRISRLGFNRPKEGFLWMVI
jgi:hypothetical protein